MRRFQSVSVCILLAAVSSGAATGQEASGALRLPPIFGDGAVLQRGKPIVVWGWATPGAPVTVAFHGAKATARADASGGWQATLPSFRAGGPFSLLITSGVDRFDSRDILIGDVWLASGQSNMEFALAQARDGAREIASARDPRQREFKIPNSWSMVPELELTGGAWTRVDPQHAGAMSAVAYYFARALRKSTGVPIGIVNSTWGGSNIETWISRGAQQLSDSAWSSIVRSEDDRTRATRDVLRARLGELPTQDAGLVNARALWAAPDLDDSAWSVMPVPSYWEENGYDGMDGVAWYRVEFDVPPSAMHGDATLSMAAIDDDDIAWVNGIRVGATTGYNVARKYRVPNSALREGRNVLAVRVADGGGGGGINGDVSVSFADGSSASLNGTWKFKVAAVSFGTDGQRINKIPTVLYNRMIHPILRFAIKGVIWYQGESNSNNVEQAAAYREQFATLIQSWRSELAQRDTFPFLWVQLPNFGKPDSVPPSLAASAWAMQRESMAGALSLPRTGQAIAIDVGEGELHPLDKRDPGVRLALVARRVAYGERAIASGPTYQSNAIRGDTIVVRFANAQGLNARGGTPGPFAIAGADRHFVWADARIEGNAIKVWSARVHGPVALRYAWANNPDHANLYNAAGLPAAPFRTDHWSTNVAVLPARTPTLPWGHAADVPTPRTDSNSMLAHRDLLAKRTKGRIDIYFVGNSITRRWGATDYPEFLANWRANFFGWNAADFGWGGDRVENMLWRIDNGELDGVNPKIIVILGGTNNVGQVPAPTAALADEKVADIARGLRVLVDRCRAKAPRATIILTGIFPRSDNVAVMPEINGINTRLASFANGTSIRYININDKLADASGKLFDGMTVDRLHPTAKGYQLWADALKPIFTELLGPPALVDRAPPPTGDPSTKKP